jgi:hypothetical protein
MSIDGRRAPGTPLARITTRALLVPCGFCWAEPATHCTEAGQHYARFLRMYRRGILGAAGLAAVSKAAPHISAGAVVPSALMPRPPAQITQAAFDDDPFGILAWRGRGRKDLLGALRLTPGTAEPARPLIDVTDRPLAECMADYWSPDMSAARLRALPPAPATPPDLLLRTFEPPPVLIRGTDLLALLTPAYERLAEADQPDEPDEIPG